MYIEPWNIERWHESPQQALEDGLSPYYRLGESQTAPSGESRNKKGRVSFNAGAVINNQYFVYTQFWWKHYFWRASFDTCCITCWTKLECKLQPLELVKKLQEKKYIYGPVSRVPTPPRPPMGWGGYDAPVVVYIHTYIPTYLPTYLHTYVHTYIHTITLPYLTLPYLTLHYLTLHSIHTYIHTITLHYLTLHYLTLHSIHTYIHIQTHIQTYIHTLITLHYITYIHTYQHTNIPTYHHHRPQGGGPEEPYHHHRPQGGGDQKNHTTTTGHRGGDQKNQTILSTHTHWWGGGGGVANAAPYIYMSTRFPNGSKW